MITNAAETTDIASGKVVWSVTMSLDGFIASPDDAMDWVFSYPEPNPRRRGNHQEHGRGAGR